MAVGYWGGNIRCRIQSEQIPDKIKVLLQDKLLGMGRPMFLWLPVTDLPAEQLASLMNGTSLVPCTCDKETSKTSDDRCFSCYGARQIPGYLKFLHQTLFFASAEAVSAPFTLTDCLLDRQVKPNRVLMNTGATTATIETTDKPYTNPDGADWEVNIDAFERSAGSTATAEFSTDGGGTFFPVADINGVNKPTGSASVRFRITLTRPAAGDKSPAWEILRLRRVQTENTNQDIVKARSVDNSYAPGQILMARTWGMERTIRDAGRGLQTDNSGDKAWTAPLDFFDISLTQDTPSVIVRDREAGPHPFYAKAYGVDIGARFPMYQESWSEELLTVTHQAFFDRRSQTNENYFLVF
jgi:hypothetical protein